MALIDASTTDWSGGITLTAKEFWQVRSEGSAVVTHEAAPDPRDGLLLQNGQGIAFASGQTIKYKCGGSAPCVNHPDPDRMMRPSPDIAVGLTPALAGQSTSLLALAAAIVTVASVGVIWNLNDATRRFQDSTGLTPAVAPGDPLGLVRDGSGHGIDLKQPVSAKRPILARAPATGRRNLLTYTEDFSNAAWVKANATVVTAGAAWKLQESAASAEHQAYTLAGQPTVLGVSYTTYFDVSPAERTECYVSFSVAGQRQGSFFNLTALTSTPDAGVTPSIALREDGSYRCQITLTAWNTTLRFAAVFTASAGSRTVLGTGTSGIIVHRAQLEMDGTATAYQKVVTAHDCTEAGQPDIWWAMGDGVTGQHMVTDAVGWGSGQVSLAAALRKNSDAAVGTVVEFSTNSSTINGTWGLFAPRTLAANFGQHLRGDAAALEYSSPTTFPAPCNAVLSAAFDLAQAAAADESRAWINGAAQTLLLVPPSTGPAGGGAIGSAAIYVGARAGTSLYLNGGWSVILATNGDVGAAGRAVFDRLCASYTGGTLP